MKRNGFTLIELLAVIVILAIIALIATPIILGIINDAREKANERSIELYASAVRNAIATYQLTGTSAPTSFSDLNVQYDGDVKCSVQELYEDGSFYLEGCKVNNGDKEYSYGTKQGTSIEAGKMSICNPLSVQTEGTYTSGDKYECDVNPNKEGYDYIFYVLNADAISVNLIMDSNINISGNAVKGEETDLGLEAWILEKDYPGSDWYTEEDRNAYGPITAMNHLQAATSGWTNTNELTINTFTDCDSNGTCTNKSMTEYAVNARMPYFSEISNLSQSTLYLIDYLSGEYDAEWGITGRNAVSGVYGYWTLSSYASIPYFAWYVDYSGYVGNTDSDSVDSYGVRPVINLSI